MSEFRSTVTRVRAAPPGRRGNRTAQIISRWIVLAAVVFAAGCTGYVGRAKATYEAGRYLEVAEDLAPRKDELHRLRPADRAQYAMYLGLSLFKLGELEGARRWLTHCLATEHAAPGSLAPHQRLRVEQTRSTLGELLGERASPALPPREGPPADGATTDGSRHREAN